MRFGKPNLRKRPGAIEEAGTGHKLARELFALVELHQGRAFISDGMEILSKADVLAMARKSLYHTNKTAAVLKTFLKKHDKPAKLSGVGENHQH